MTPFGRKDINHQPNSGALHLMALDGDCKAALLLAYGHTDKLAMFCKFNLLSQPILRSPFARGSGVV